MSKFFLPVSVRFKADLSVEEFSSALADAVAGNISQLVLAFQPAGDFGTFGEFAERRVVEEVVGSLPKVGVEPEVVDLFASKPRRHGRGGDRTIYKLRNRDGRTASGKQADLKARLGMSHVKMNRLLNTPGHTTRDGWYRPKTRAARGTKGE